MGLTEEQVRTSRKVHGSNTLSRKKRKSFLQQFISSFGDPIIKILLVALGVNVLFLFQDADWFEAVGIAVAIFLATFISTLSEYGSESAFLELQRSAADITCRVQRAKGVAALPVSDVVVGDLILLQAGERIPADGVIIAGKLSVDQSALNGESAEAEKQPLNTRSECWDLNCTAQLFQGSVITAGEGIMQVQRVGDQTFYGSMAQDLQEETPESPLKLRLNGLAKAISRLGYIAAGLIAFADLFNSFLIDNNFDISLAIADFSHPIVWIPRILHALTLATAVVVMAVPEGLPMMITVVLSSNMFRMLKDQVMVRKLVGIETSGSLNILFTDKTGTLTKGKLQVVHIIDGNGKCADHVKKCNAAVREMLTLSALYNTGCVLASGKALGGNATDRALLESVLPIDLKKYNYSVKARLPFDSANKFSAVHLNEKEHCILVKGAPEKILSKCTYYLDEKGERRPFNPTAMEDQRKLLSAKAVRMLAVAVSPTTVTAEGNLHDLTFIALIGIRDDIRREVPAAIAEVQQAGVQVVMMTGDSKDTAIAIARDAGLIKEHKPLQVITSTELAAMSDQQVQKLLPELRVIARALPTDKSRLVRLAQQQGLVTGMTGDGINDAPALKRADVGFSMGSGTEVAKEAGDIVILDNNFASIAKAIRYGRTIFKSIRKFIVYQFTMNLSAVGVSLIGPFIGIDTPVTVIQMLWINIIMDTLAGLAFAGEPPLREYMKERPKKRDEPIIDRTMAQQIFCMGLYTMTLCIAFLGLPYFRNLFHFSENPIYFLTAFYALFIFSGVFNSFNARTERLSPLANLRKNPLFLLIMLAVSIVQLIMIYFGGRVFRTAGLTPAQLQMIVLMAFSVIPADLFRKILWRIKKRNKGKR
jgi:calcium-translocating P-type ATPase